MPTFRYTHRDNEQTIVFGAEKVKNWEGTKIGITRNDTFRGLMRKYSGTLEFVKDIRRRIIRVMDKYGSEASIHLKVEVGNDNKDRSSFRTLGSGELKADMTTLTISELDAKLNYVGSDFEEVLMNRIDNDVLYDTHTSIDGESIPTFDNEIRTIQLHDRVLELNDALDIDSTNVELTGNFVTSYIPVAFTKAYTSDDDFKNVPISVYSDKNAAESFFILQASSNKDININYSISTYLQIQINAGVWFYKISKRKVDVNYIEISEDVIFDSDFIFGSGLQNIPVNYDADIVENLNEGESLQLLISITQQNPITADPIIFGYYPNKNAIVSNSKSYFPATTAECILPHELFSRFSSIYTGEQMPFYSEIFGRVDLGYAHDGEWAYLVALNGLMIRDFPKEKHEFAASLKDAFKAYNCILNIGATIEQLPSGQHRLRIDKYENMFGSKVVVRLGSLLTGVERSLNKKLLFSELLIGYKDQEYEELNGLGTFNGTTKVTSNLKSVSTKMDLVCPWRTDDYGIELTRRKQYKDAPTEDYRSDENIFLIDAIMVDDELVARTDQDFTLIEGILNPTSAYNLRLSPARNIRRWGNVIRSAMPFGGTLKFGNGAKNTNLITQLTGEMAPIVEKADIDVTTLDNPIMLPESISIGEAPLTMDQWLLIESNQDGLIEIESKGVYLYGYLEELEYSPAKKTVTGQLNRANR